MRSMLPALAACALVTGCAPPATWRDLDISILSPNVGARALHVCSRDPPAPANGFWRPNLEDIAALEAMLPDAVAADPYAGSVLTNRPPKGWRRQYIGLERDGRRTIYGNFFPRYAQAGDWRRRPFDLCDGGPKYFGVEYDPATRRIIDLEFNGMG